MFVILLVLLFSLQIIGESVEPKVPRSYQNEDVESAFTRLKQNLLDENQTVSEQVNSLLLKVLDLSIGYTTLQNQAINYEAEIIKIKNDVKILISLLDKLNNKIYFIAKKLDKGDIDNSYQTWTLIIVTPILYCAAIFIYKHF